MDPRLISARVALQEERDRDDSAYLSKMKELVTQVISQEGPQDVGEALVQLAGYYMRDFRLCTRLREIGAAPPRSEDQWAIFSECGKVLDEWTRKAFKTLPRRDDFPLKTSHVLVFVKEEYSEFTSAYLAKNKEESLGRMMRRIVYQ
ncbi:hypothetical protein PR003_g30590, partial [Phytophthora rubi]